MWAMLPLVARQVLNGGPTLYGLLLTSIGAGAVAGALVMPSIKKRLGPDRTVALGTIGVALVLVLFATVTNELVAIGASALAGCDWPSVARGIPHLYCNIDPVHCVSIRC